MPKFYMVNHDTHEVVSAPVIAEERPRIQSQDWGFLNVVQCDAFVREDDPDNGGSSIEGADMKDGSVYCIGCVPDEATTEDVHVYLWDDPDKTPGRWFCDKCANIILEDDAEKCTTTCWICGRDYPDEDMIPRECGEGELCPSCVKTHK